jgi:hypothetical protein
MIHAAINPRHDNAKALLHYEVLISKPLELATLGFVQNHRQQDRGQVHEGHQHDVAGRGC